MWKLFINFCYLHYFYLIFYLFNFLFQLIQKSYNGAKFRGPGNLDNGILINDNESLNIICLPQYSNVCDIVLVPLSIEFVIL